MPQALAMGITYYEFWGMTPRIINVMVKGRELYIENEFKKQDFFAWLQGLYMRDALSSTVGNMFRGKNEKPYEYPQKPYNEEELNNIDIEAQCNMFWESLHIMQTNFELSKQSGE